MSCSPFDLRDYFLRELTSPQQLQVESHVKTCGACREELERLRVTEAALFSLRDEEIPQRIGFVSDKIFEPSPMRRWFAAFWGSTARLGFASAAMLSVAIAYSAWHRVPAPAPVTSAALTPVSAAEHSLTPAQVDQKIRDAVTKAVADVEAQYAEKNRVQLAEFQKAADDVRMKLVLVEEEFDREQRRARISHTANMVRPGQERGEPK